MNSPNTPIYVAPPSLKLPDPAVSQPSHQEMVELLRQLTEIQKEQLALTRQQVAAADSLARWRAFLARWQEEYPLVGQNCKQILPVMERVYLRMIQELTDRLRGEEADDMDNEFVLTEFLDRYGLRLSQLGTIIGQLSPLADAAPPPPTNET